MSHSPATPLDPDARALLDRLNQLNAPGYETMTPASARLFFAHTVDNAAIPKVRVGAVEDVQITCEGRDIPARRYRPFGAEAAGPVPALVYFHGGGWTIGDLQTMDHLCRSLVRSCGIEVLSVDYPLSPEAPFPEPLHACAAALRWVIENAGPMGLDPARIGVGGDSAGGNLAAALSLMARDGTVPAPRVQCLIYPALELTCAQPSHTILDHMLYMHRATMDWFVGNYVADAAQRRDWRASPLLAGDVGGVAPAFVLTAGYDVLHDEGVAYAERLERAGVPVTARSFGGQMHNFIALPHHLPTAYAAIGELAEFLVSELCGHSGA